MKYTNIFYAKHPGNDKQYIFALPFLDNKVAKGDRLRVACRDGEKTVIATSENWIVTEELAKATTSAMGEYWPLAQAYGKMEYVNAEYSLPLFAPSERRYADMSKPCKYESEDGICINADCPIPDDIPDVCKWEDRTQKGE